VETESPSNVSLTWAAWAAARTLACQRALDFVLEDSFQHVDLALDVDQRGLEPFHVDGARELQVQLIERQEVGQGHGVADDHHVPVMSGDDRAAAHVVRGIRDHGQRKGCRGAGIDVLADLAHATLDLALDLAEEVRAPVRVESRLGELFERRR
jgi:hypothetical protein